MNQNSFVVRKFYLGNQLEVAVAEGSCCWVRRVDLDLGLDTEAARVAVAVERGSVMAAVPRSTRWWVRVLASLPPGSRLCKDSRKRPRSAKEKRKKSLILIPPRKLNYHTPALFRRGLYIHVKLSGSLKFLDMHFSLSS